MISNMSLISETLACLKHLIDATIENVEQHANESRSSSSPASTAETEIIVGDTSDDDEAELKPIVSCERQRDQLSATTNNTIAQAVALIGERRLSSIFRVDMYSLIVLAFVSVRVWHARARIDKKRRRMLTWRSLGVNVRRRTSHFATFIVLPDAGTLRHLVLLESTPSTSPPPPQPSPSQSQSQSEADHQSLSPTQADHSQRVEDANEDNNNNKMAAWDGVFRMPSVPLSHFDMIQETQPFDVSVNYAASQFYPATQLQQQQHQQQQPTTSSMLDASQSMKQHEPSGSTQTQAPPSFAIPSSSPPVSPTSGFLSFVPINSGLYDTAQQQQASTSSSGSICVTQCGTILIDPVVAPPRAALANRNKPSIAVRPGNQQPQLHVARTSLSENSSVSSSSNSSISSSTPKKRRYMRIGLSKSQCIKKHLHGNIVSPSSSSSSLDQHNSQRSHLR